VNQRETSTQEICNDIMFPKYHQKGNFHVKEETRNFCSEKNVHKYLSSDFYNNE
jgi:hypothetical protein